MLAITRYRVPTSEAAEFLELAKRAQDALSKQKGWYGGRIGRATDDATLWVLTSQWADVGSYRRALGAFEVKVEAIPLLARAIDEPTAFEILGHQDSGNAYSEIAHDSGRTRLAADADSIGIGEAAAPVVPTDLD